MNRDQFHAAYAARLPARRTFYHRLRRLAEADKLPLGVATQHGGKWRFDLPNPKREREQVEAIIGLINEAARRTGRTMILCHYEGGRLWINNQFKRRVPVALLTLLDAEYLKWERDGCMRVLVSITPDGYAIVGQADQETKAV